MPAATDTATAAADPVLVEEAFRRYHGLVYRSAYRVTGRAADAEDVLQNVFLRLLRRPAAIRDVDGVESYLHRAAVNAALDLLRSRQRAAAAGSGDSGADGIADWRLAADRGQESGEIRDWLRRAVARLSPTAAEAVVLRFFEGRGNQEIARLLGTSASTVAVTLHRARERLQEEYREAFGAARGARDARGLSGAGA